MKAVTQRIKVVADRFITEVPRWLSGARGILLWLALFIITIWAARSVPEAPWSARINWIGTAFELYGIVGVIWGIDRSRRQFGQPSILSRPWRQLAEMRFFFLAKPSRNASVNAAIPCFSVEGAVVVEAWPGGSIDRQITELRNWVTTLRREIADINVKLNQEVRNLSSKIQNESSARKAEFFKVNKQLEEGVIGDSGLEAGGALFLLLGLPCSNMSEQVSDLLVWFF